MQVAREILVEPFNQLLYQLLTNLPNKALNVPVHVIIAHTVTDLTIVILAEVILIDSEESMIAAAHFKPPVLRDTHSSCHNTIEKHNQEMLKYEWKNNLQLSI